MIPRVIVPLFAITGLLPAFGFVHTRTSGIPLRWELASVNANVHTNVVNRNTRAIRYYLGSAGWSTTNTAAELNALRASFGQWQSISGTILKFEDAGLASANADVNTSDHSNILFWARSSTLVNNGMSDISGRLGVTFTSFLLDGTLLEADIAFNGVQYDWFTDFNNTNTMDQFVEGTALHEMGHFLGLAHSPVGSASMLYVGADGVDNQAGLSADEIAAARFIYVATNQAGARATLKGQVTRGGAGILGAAVFVEDSATNIIAGTVTRAGGNYELNALPPGIYQVRVAPLDPGAAADWLVRGRDISSEFNSAETTFLPTSGTNVTLAAGATNTLDLSVINANPAFRITNIRFPTANANSYSWGGLPTTLRPGQTNITIGVASADLPASGATFSISGDGLTIAAPTFNPNAFGTGLNFISARVSVAANATAGVRTFVVQQGTNAAYANGFVEILPSIPDYNFDGLDDTFQRRWFPLFTATNAAPSADPDGDTFLNSSEAVAGTNPTNATSLLRIDSITQNASGAAVTWRSVAGKSYQLLYRSPIGAAGWTAVGTPVVAAGATAQKLDPNGVATNRFYRVQMLP